MRHVINNLSINYFATEYEVEKYLVFQNLYSVISMMLLIFIFYLLGTESVLHDQSA